jgi:hypothetical protein
MLKRLAVAVMGVLVATGSAAAFQCPLLIKQLSDAVATMNPSDAKVKERSAAHSRGGEAS